MTRTRSLAQSISGTAALNDKGQMPMATAVGQADLLTSLFINQSVLAAIYSREKTGKGQKIEANLLNSVVGFHVQEIQLISIVDLIRSEVKVEFPILGWGHLTDYTIQKMVILPLV